MAEKNYWLFVTDDINWCIIKKNLIWGVRKKYINILNRTNLGDAAIVYIKGRKLGGSFKVNSKPYLKNGIFAGLFNYNIDLTAINIPSEPVYFSDDVIKRLKFITNKKKWSLHFFGRSVKNISKEDFEYLNSLMR